MEELYKKIERTYWLTQVLSEYCHAHSDSEELYCTSFLVDVISQSIDETFINARRLNEKDHS